MTLSACDEQCDAYAAPDIYYVEQRNPDTGLCEATSGGGGGWGDGCGGLYETDVPGNEAPGLGLALNWAECYGACTGLAEDQCQSTPGCQAAYTNDCADCAPDNTSYTFIECWETTDPPALGACEQLDAWSCTTRDDCVKRHVGQGNLPASAPPDSDALFIPTIGLFESCAAEDPQAMCYGDEDCDDDERCNAAEICLGCGGGSDPACDAACRGYCVPKNDPGQCYGEVTCESLPPNCESGSIPGRDNGCWTGQCILIEDCGPVNPAGRCYDEPACDAPPPECPAGTLPGVGDGCWTGYCIPIDMCEAPPACASLTTELQCAARADCEGIYEGSDCSCTPNGCTCNVQEFLYCQAAAE